MASRTIRSAIDTFVREDRPLDNYAGWAGIRLQAAGGGATNRGLMYFPLPFDPGDTIIRADLKLYLKGAWTGGPHVITVSRLIASWIRGKAIWATQPSDTVTNQATASVTGGADGQLVTVNLIAMMGDIAAGADWFGVLLQVSTTGIKKLHSSEVSDDDFRPVLEIEWVKTPAAPIDLKPSGNRSISLSKPVLQWTFKDADGDESQSELEVQIDNASDFATPTYDSGFITSALTELDLAATAFGGITDNTSVWWRVRSKDSGGRTSAWSDPVQISRSSKGTLTITNPPLKTNLLSATRSTDFSVWDLTNAGVVNNAIAAPDGTVTGDKLTETADTGRHEAWTSLFDKSALPQGHSVYAKAAERTWLRVGYSGDGNAAWFDLAAGEVGQVTAGITAEIEELSDGWYRCTIADPLGDASYNCVVAPATANGVESYLGVVNSGLYVWHPQAEDNFFVSPWVVGGGEVSSSVEETTPPITWTFTGRTQVQVRLSLLKKQPNGKYKEIWRKGRHKTTDLSITLPKKLLTKESWDYKIVVDVWDTIDREGIPGDTAYVRAERVFQYVRSGAAGAVHTLNAVGSGVTPGVQLDFVRASQPDFFCLKVDGEIVDDRIDSNDVLNGAPNYLYVYWGAKRGVQHTYEVEAVVLDTGKYKHSDANATRLFTHNAKGIWLIAPESGIEVHMISPGAAPQMGIGEAGTTHFGIGARAPVRITHTIRGYEGSVSAWLVPYDGKTADDWRDRFEELKGLDNSEEIRLVLGTRNFPILLEELEMPPNSKLGYGVGFGFRQVDEFTFEVRGREI